MYVGPFYFLNLSLFLAGGGVSLVIPVQGTETQQLLTTRGHDVILFNWSYENATFDCSLNSKNFTVIATVESNRNKAGNRWNDGKADAKGRLWAGRVSSWTKILASNQRRILKY
jgi:sugar lactone lactonase YvrE